MTEFFILTNKTINYEIYIKSENTLPFCECKVAKIKMWKLKKKFNIIENNSGLFFI
jgi:hypothetical protein